MEIVLDVKRDQLTTIRNVKYSHTFLTIFYCEKVSFNRGLHTHVDVYIEVKLFLRHIEWKSD